MDNKITGAGEARTALATPFATRLPSTTLAGCGGSIQPVATRGARRTPTIFRCLCDLTEVGLAIRTDLGDHVWRFGFRGHHAEDADHPHFVCLDCGAATCLPELNVRITPTQQQEIGDVTEVVLKGHCPNCR